MLLLKSFGVHFSDLVRTGVLNIIYSLRKSSQQSEWTGTGTSRRRRGALLWTTEMGPRGMWLPGPSPHLSLSLSDYSSPWSRPPASSSASLLAIPLKTTGETTVLQSLHVSAPHSFPMAQRWPSLSHRWSGTFLLGSSRLIPISCLQVMVFFVIPQTPPYLRGNCLPQCPVLMAPPPMRLSLILPHSKPPTLFTTLFHCRLP